MTEHTLFGSYELVTHGTYSSDGKFIPTSDYLNGHLIYGEGYELAVLIQFTQSPQGPRDLLAYTGTFRVENSNQLVHEIKLCSQSQRNNSNEVRSYKVEADLLTLEAMLANGVRFQATWRRTLKLR